MVKNDILICQKWVKFLTEILNFLGHLSTFTAENTPKSGPFKTKKNAQTHPKKLPHNLEKVEKSTFLTPKMAKNDPSERRK